MPRPSKVSAQSPTALSNPEFKNMKLKLTRDEKEMIHLVALATFMFTLIGTAIVILALSF